MLSSPSIPVVATAFDVPVMRPPPILKSNKNQYLEARAGRRLRFSGACSLQRPEKGGVSSRGSPRVEHCGGIGCLNRRGTGRDASRSTRFPGEFDDDLLQLAVALDQLRDVD